jgi:hypothetical protein
MCDASDEWQWRRHAAEAWATVRRHGVGSRVDRVQEKGGDGG